MSPEIHLILSILSILLFFLFLSAIFIIGYVVYDIRSGNYRKLLSAQGEHEQSKNQVQEVRSKSL